MKALNIDYDICLYPEGINSPTEFAAYLEGNLNKFIEIKYFGTENCVAPYYIAEEVKTRYLNVTHIGFFCEEEITVLSREEYNERLKAVIAKKCVNCVNYVDDGRDEDICGKLCLDGTCWSFEKKSVDD